VYGPNEGSAATGAYTARSRKTPKAFGLSAGGELAHQSGVNKRRRDESRVIAVLSRESWRPPSAPRDPARAHRTLRTLRSSTLKNKTHRPPHQPPGRHPISIVRNREPSPDRTVARTIETISETHDLVYYLGEFRWNARSARGNRAFWQL